MTTQIKAPRGVSGSARQAFLTLTDEQKIVYRDNFCRMGRPAWLCLRVAQTGQC